MPYKKNIKPKAANDNRHHQFGWRFIYNFLEFWLERQRIPVNLWNYNRSIHYMYEIFNKPWLYRDGCGHEVTRWLKNEAAVNGFSTRELTDDDIPYYSSKF